MKKFLGTLTTGSLVVGLALTFAAPAFAQTATTTGSTNSSVYTTTGTASTTTTGTTDTTGMTGTTNTTAPGLPNTGAGGDAAMNVTILLASGLVAVGAAVLIGRKLSVNA